MVAGGVVARRAGARLTDGALRELAAGEDVERLAQAPGGAWVQFRRHGGAPSWRSWSNRQLLQRDYQEAVLLLAVKTHMPELGCVALAKFSCVQCRPRNY